MFQIRLLAAVGLVALATAGSVRAEDDLAAVEAKIGEKIAAQKTMQSKIFMETRMESPGVTMEMRGEGTVQWMRKGDKVMTRYEMKNEMKQRFGEQQQTMEQTTLAISDGSYTYTLTEMMGRKQAAKLDLEPQFSGVPAAFFKVLREHNTLSLEPDQTVEGCKSWVILATPTEGADEPGANKTRMYFCQENGFLLKLESLDKDGKAVTTLTYRDLRTGVDLDEKLFVFETPEGVQLNDISTGARSGAATGTQPASAPATTAPATTQPANP